MLDLVLVDAFFLRVYCACLLLDEASSLMNSGVIASEIKSLTVPHEDEIRQSSVGHFVIVFVSIIIIFDVVLSVAVIESIHRDVRWSFS